MQFFLYNFGNLFKSIFEITFVFKLKKISPLNKFALLQLIIYIGNIFMNLTGHLEKNLKFDFRPYSAFIFGSRNRRPNSENFRFRPKISASGIPLIISSSSNKLFVLKSSILDDICIAISTGWKKRRIYILVFSKYLISSYSLLPR